MRFRDRREAGVLLGKALEAHRLQKNLIVLGLPRGGVPVAWEIARVLEAPLDVFVVRKLGVPFQEELAMGAIASGGEIVRNEEVVRSMGISDASLKAVAARERNELVRREWAYRGDRPLLDLARKTVILVDDGLATGSTMRAAIAAVKRQKPERIVVAVPVGAKSTCERLRDEGVELTCLHEPAALYAISLHYDDFAQVSDDDVRALLRKAGDQSPEAGGAEHQQT